MLQWDVRPGSLLGAALTAQLPWVGARGSGVAVCAGFRKQGSGSLALPRDQPGIRISLAVLMLVSVSAPRVADKSHLSHRPAELDAGCGPAPT